MATAKQIAARKKFAERARSGELAKMRKKNPAKKPTRAASRKANPSSKNSTFYVTANLGFGESKHFKTSVSPGANSPRSAANKVAKFLGYPVFVSSRNERPTSEGFPVVRYEFVDDEQTKAVDIFVYPVKIEGRKYSTIRESNPTATRAPARKRTKLISNGERKKNPVVKTFPAYDNFRFKVETSKDGVKFMNPVGFPRKIEAINYAKFLAGEMPDLYIRVYELTAADLSYAV